MGRQLNVPLQDRHLMSPGGLQALDPSLLSSSCLWLSGSNVPKEKAAADPVSVPPGSSGRSNWCNEHNTIHRHLDAIEEVEKTVEYLESEVKTLLKDISETAWSAPIAPGTRLVDIFDDAS
ncbi:placenta-specific protein 9-like isoform X2 [Mauremys mutica]|uniref:placenta-specific protein 9-like isoform X2 n=1 Tax=Mauremys mutica TaxID=74926 RepID=UPI001D164CC2|nr:placenta-specific protein 9-like isoform X2 [Mauremys mutica]